MTMAGLHWQRCRRGLRKKCWISQVAKDLVLNLQFLLIGKLVAIMAEDFDAVVLPWIMRCRDDYARMISMFPREKSDSRRRDDSGAFYGGPAFDKSSGNRCTDPLARFTRVHAQNHAWDRGRTTKRMRQSQSDCMNRARIKRGFTSHRPNAIGPKKLSHILCSVCTTVLVTMPRESRVRKVSPLAIADASWS